jgi:perosamine synthetase
MKTEIPLSNPDITELERERVLEVLSTPNLSLGPKLVEFEKKFANYVGSAFAVAVNSGTSALHLCVKALDIRSGERVFTTPFRLLLVLSPLRIAFYSKAHTLSLLILMNRA